MTAIAIWCNHEVANNPSLWIAADSRITSSNSVLVEDGAKIFPLQVICRSPDTTGMFTKICHAHSYGYCFAGSTLMGQNSYLGLTPILGNLITLTGQYPSLGEVADYTHKYLQKTFEEYAFHVGGNAAFEVCLFGYCPQTNSLSAHHFHPIMNSLGLVEIGRTDAINMKDKDFLYLGDEKPTMKNRIDDAFKGQTVPGRPLSRIPKHIILDCIADENLPTIGGNLQLGIADEFGFRPYAICRPIVPGEPGAYISYLGKNLSGDMAQVGPAIVGGPAMA